MRRRQLWKRSAAVVLAGVMLLGGCGKSQNEGNAKTSENGKGEVQKVRYVTPGDMPTDADVVVDEINKRLEEDGMNLEFEMIRIPWDVWDQKVNTMLATGEEFELLHAMHDRVPAGVYAGRDVLTPLNDIIDKYPNLKEKFNEEDWKQVSVEGKIYGIPTKWRNFGKDIGVISYRQDVLDSLGLKAPETVDELIETGKAIQGSFSNDKTPYVWHHNINYPPYWLYRTLDSWPFYVDLDLSLFKVDQEGNVSSYYESEEYKKAAETYRRLYNEGLIHPDILSVPPETKLQDANEGRFVFGFQTLMLDQQNYYNVNHPDMKIGYTALNKEKENLVNLTISNSNVIPNTAKNPEAGIKFLDWLYSDPANHDLLINGIEGVHYEDTGEKRMKGLTREDEKPNYFFDSWQVGYIDYVRYGTDGPEEFVEEYLDYSTTDKPWVIEGESVYSPVIGFTFNEEPVATEMANLRTEVVQSMYPITWGVVDYEEAYPAAIERLKAAGLDTVVEEYQNQLKAFMEGMK